MSSRRDLFSPFRSSRYTTVWSGAFISNIGTWMESITIGAYIIDVTHQSKWSGIIGAAAFVPNAVFAPLGGALADRISRRGLLIFTNTCQALVAATLAVLVGTDHAPPLLITVLVFIGSSVGSMGFPAYMSVLPDLVPESEIPAAVALSSTQWNLGRVVGPLVSGYALVHWGYSAALWINAASFAGPILAMLLISLPNRVAATKESVRASMMTGYRFTRNDPPVWLALRSLMVAAFFAAPFIALIPAMAKLTLDSGSDAVGWLTAGQGIGAVIAAVLLGAARKQFGASTSFIASCLIMIPSLLLYAIAPNVATSTLALVFVGGAYLAVFVSLTTTAQLRAAPELRGRTLSTFMIVLGVLFPLGSLIQGYIGDLVGLRWTTAGSAVICALIMGYFLVLRDSYFAPLDEIPPSNDDRGSDYS